MEVENMWLRMFHETRTLRIVGTLSTRPAQYLHPFLSPSPEVSIHMKGDFLGIVSFAKGWERE
jgi:hypothetical protein